MIIFRLFFAAPLACFSLFYSAQAADLNDLIVRSISEMPAGGAYAKYQKSQPGREFEQLYQTVSDLNAAIGVGLGAKKLKIEPQKAGQYSFCSSATYLLFLEVLETLQREGGLKLPASVNRELADAGDKTAVIHGKLDGIGLFGHWNADGPGTAVLFERLDLGDNFSNIADAKPGDFLKIWWNESIGKGERGHLVVYLGTNADGSQVQVWSSNMDNTDGSHGYGTMWVERTRIKRALFSRLQRPENLSKWASFSEDEKKSQYLIGIRKTPSTGAEMLRVTGAKN